MRSVGEKMGTSEISVIVTIYNQSEESILKTIRSIAKQRGCSYQLILADDHSTEDPSSFLCKCCADLGIVDYQIVRQEENRQTVRNIYGALQFAVGRYVKVIGAGDELYCESTLLDIVSFCRTYGVAAGFGRIVLDGKMGTYCAPKNYADYPPMGNAIPKDLFAHQVVMADWIPGCAQFFETSVLRKLLGTLIQFDIRYCEDFAQTVWLMSNPVFCLDAPVLVYEWGSGISTTGNDESVAKLYRDHNRFYGELKTTTPYGETFVLARVLFMVREFVAMKTPLYRLLQRRVANSYIKKSRERCAVESMESESSR